MSPTPCLSARPAALALTAAITAALAAPAARAGNFTETFDGAGLSPLLAYSASDPGFGFANHGGWGDFSKAAGTGNGFGYLRTTFQVAGDFVAGVDLLRDGLVGQGEAGLDLRFFSTYPNGFADLWSQGLQTLVSNVYLPAPPGFGSQVLPWNRSVARLSATRIGQTLTFYVDGMKLREETGPTLTGPVTVELFLGQEADQTVGHHALFDNLTIRGDFVNAPVPEPASYALLGAGLALLGARARWRRHAPAQRRPA